MVLEIEGYELEGEVLYLRDRIAITTNPRTVDEHDLVVGKYHQYLGRGVLEEFSRADRQHFKSGIIWAMSQGRLEYALEDAELNLDDLRVAFSQARIKELELERENVTSKFTLTPKAHEDL